MNTDTKPRKPWKTPTVEVLAVNGGGARASVEAGKTLANTNYYIYTVDFVPAAKSVVFPANYKSYHS